MSFLEKRPPKFTDRVSNRDAAVLPMVERAQV
jgi:hypothetical protein